jgi:hypothetical protein
MSKRKTITRTIVDRVKKLVGYGLSDGLGDRGRGTMCVQACVNAALEDAHDDQPKCVPQNRTDFGIALNDRAGWSSDEARGKGLKRWAIAQLGTSTRPDKDLPRLAIGEMYRQRFKALVEATEECPSELLPYAERVASHADAERFFEKLEAYCEKRDKDIWDYPELDSLKEALVEDGDSLPDWENVFAFFYDHRGSDAQNTAIAEIGVQACIKMRTEGSEWLEEYDSKAGAERDKFIQEQTAIGVAQEEAARKEAAKRAAETRQFMKKNVDDWSEYLDD